MKRPTTTLWLVLLAVMAGGCGGGSAERLALSGRVVAGPSCPVESQSADPSCADRPVVGAVLVIRDPDDEEITRVTSDDDGRFSVDLPAGAYTVVPQAVDGLLGTPPPIEVELRAGEPPTPVTVAYDTGIR